jgi:hypothetical protein
LLKSLAMTRLSIDNLNGSWIMLARYCSSAGTRLGFQIASFASTTFNSLLLGCDLFRSFAFRFNMLHFVVTVTDQGASGFNSFMHLSQKHAWSPRLEMAIAISTRMLLCIWAKCEYSFQPILLFWQVRLRRLLKAMGSISLIVSFIGLHLHETKSFIFNNESHISLISCGSYLLQI